MEGPQQRAACIVSSYMNVSEGDPQALRVLFHLFGAFFGRVGPARDEKRVSRSAMKKNELLGATGHEPQYQA
jgi:hypothetical protein